METAIEIVAHSAEWKKAFEELANHFKKNITASYISIEHVGSTAVEGLPAKPILDIDIIIEKDATILKDISKDLQKIGYTFLGDMGITGRFAYRLDLALSLTQNQWMSHNLYVCYENSTSLVNHLLFRDYLKNNPEQKEAYGMLKKALAKKFPYDIDAYVAGKTHFITEILSQIGFDKQSIQTIIKQNEIPQN